MFCLACAAGCAVCTGTTDALCSACVAGTGRPTASDPCDGMYTWYMVCTIVRQKKSADKS